MPRKGSTQPRCSSKTARGQRCKRTALEGTRPPKCVSHIGVNGRKTALTEQVAANLVALLRAGNYIDVAVAAAGVGRRTFYGWLDRGDPARRSRADAPYREFRKRIELARAEGEALNVAVIAKAATDDWKAAAWLLERGASERWARTTMRPIADPLRGGGEPTTPAQPVSGFEELDAGDELAARRAQRD